MGNTMLSTSEAMSSIYTQLSGTDKGVLPLVEACNLILDYILKNGFGSSTNNPLTPAQLEKIKEDVINKVKTQVPLGVLLKDCELNNSKIKFTLSDNSIKELDLTSLITNTVRDYVNTHKTELKGQKGDKGEQGLQGNNGTSLDYEWQGTKLGIKKSSESSYSYVDLKGSQGIQGLQGINGEKGVGIKDISINGNNLSIKLDDESIKVITLPLLKGEQGLNGNDGVGITNITNVGSELTISLSNGTNKKFTIPTIKGDNGTQGLNGENGIGISNIEKIGTKLVITLTNNQKKEFELPISSNSGTTGGTSTSNGRDGVSLDFTWNGTQLGIKKSTDTDYTYTELKGQKGDNGLNGVQGEQGVSLDFNWQGTQLGIKKDTESTYTYKELKGEQGVQGLRGERGHNSVIVSETEPNKAEYDVWIKPTENGIDIESLLQQGSQGASDNNKLIKGTGSPKGIVQTEVNTLYLDKAKTNGAYLWLKTGNNNTDWKVIKGDTGTIEFTSKVLDGKIRIRRIDNWVILNFGGLQWDLFRLKPKAEVNGSSARKYTYNGNTALQLRLTNKTNLTQFAIPYGLRSVYPIYTPLFHDSGVLLGSIFIAPNSDGNQIRFNIMSTEYADNGYVDLRCSNIIYYTDDDYPENLQNLIRGLTQ